MKKLAIIGGGNAAEYYIDACNRIGYETHYFTPVYCKTAKNECVNIVLIYRSNDIKQFIGEFTIRGYVSGTPKEVREKTKNIRGIDEDSYFDYF